MRSLSTYGSFSSASVTFSMSVMTLPFQSPEIADVYAWPKPVEPCGFGNATT